MAAKPGAILDIVLGKSKGKPMPAEDDEGAEGNAAAEDAASALLDAISQGDPKALVQAFKDLGDTCGEADYGE